MKCSNCNYESDADFAFCPNCGAKQGQPQSQEVQQQPQFQQQNNQQGYVPYQAPKPQPLFYGNGNERIIGFFKDTLFLVVAILFSVYSVLNILKLPVIEILFTIFFWMIYVSARNNAVTSNQVKWVSGTTFAKVIINYVGCGLLVLIGIFALIGTSALGSALGSTVNGSVYGKNVSGAGVAAGVGSVGLVILIVLIICAAISFLITFLGIRPIQKLVQSCYKSLEVGSLHLEKAGSAKIWLMIFGILKALGALGSLLSGAALRSAMSAAMNSLSRTVPAPVMSILGISTGVDFLGFIANASLAAAYIILAIMFGKYFGDIAQAQKMQQMQPQMPPQQPQQYQ